MCDWYKFGDTRIDPCMINLVTRLLLEGYKTKACCCGHGKYPRTVVIEKDGKNIEFFSKVEIPRVRRFYKRDAQGVYFIPELASLNP